MPRKKKLQEVGGLRLVAYYRYSNGGQQTEQSIEGQRRDCEAYAKAHGYKIVHEYIDRHISGKSDSRPAFQQMISDSDSHLFDAVICWKTDRLARSRYDSIIYKTRRRHRAGTDRPRLPHQPGQSVQQELHLPDHHQRDVSWCVQVRRHPH